MNLFNRVMTKIFDQGNTLCALMECMYNTAHTTFSLTLHTVK